MSIRDSRLHRWLEVATDFFLLGLLWLAACLPVVTAFPSTAAMFGVVRDRVHGKEDGLMRTFFAHFRDTFGRSLLVGTIWVLFGAALFLDFFVVDQFPFEARIVLKSLLLLLSLMYAFGSVFLFPVLVNYEAGPKTVIKNSILLSVGRLPTTLACLAFVAVAAGLTAAFPFLLTITGSVTAYVVYRLCDRAFRSIDAASGSK